jgi:hypothetical protein
MTLVKELISERPSNDAITVGLDQGQPKRA